MSLKEFLQKLLPQISKQQAVAIAKEECSKQGWPCLEPIYVHWDWHTFGRTWEVITNSEMRGGNAFIHIDRYTGKVIRVGFGPK